MCTRSPKNEAVLAYRAGFALVAVLNTFLLLQVADGEFVALFITEFGSGELMHSTYALRLKKWTQQNERRSGHK